MKNMKLSLLCWLSKSVAWEEHWDLLCSKCRGAPGVAHSTADGWCHRAHSVLLQGVVECGLLLLWHLAEALCSALRVVWKSVLQVAKVRQFTWPLESQTGKCQFRSSHVGAIYLQGLSLGLLALGLSVFFSSNSYTQI